MSKEEKNIARPCILKNNGIYEAWFSYGYGGEYQIGYARSDDGFTFKRNIPNPPIIQKSETYYENSAVCHPAVVLYNGKKFMFYNGNKFGYDGVALAIEK